MILKLWTTFLLALAFTLMAPISDVFPQKDSTGNEIDIFIRRLSHPENVNMLQGSLWTLTHDYKDSKHVSLVMKEAMAFLDAFAKHRGGDPAPLVKLGGVGAFKARLIEWVGDREQAVRAFSCVLIGIAGDKDLAPHLAKLLEENPLKDVRDVRYDRGRALIALGVLGAVEYKTKIASYIQSRNEHERSGAIYALGYLDAKEYSAKIAGVLEDPEMIYEDDTSPISFLVDTGTAKDHKPALLKALRSPYSSELSVAAAYALASLDSTEHAKDIALLLDDEFRRADAAKALALMGAAEYKPRIARLLDDKSGLVRSAAVLALGILDADEYTAQIAALLSDTKSYVHSYAATAIVLIQAKEHYPAALPLLADPSINRGYITSEASFSPLVREKAQTLTARLRKNLDQARKN